MERAGAVDRTIISESAAAREIVFAGTSAQMSGVEFSTIYFLQKMDRARWCATVLLPENGDLAQRARAAGAETVIVPGPRFVSVGMTVAGRTVPNPAAIVKDAGAIVEAARRWAALLRERPPAVVVTKGLLAHFAGGLAARWANLPCVWHVQDRVSERLGPVYPAVLSLAGRLLADRIIVDAESIARQLRQFVPSDRIAVIWNGVDTDEFSPNTPGRETVRAQWQAGPDDLLVGVIGRLTPWKGQHLAVEALARIASRCPKVKLVLVGSALFATDEYERSLRAQAARLGLEQRVVFAGFRWDLPQVLAALDVVVHPSVEKDSSPLAVVSALAAGKPIVCAGVGGTAELFSDGEDGLLFAPGNADELTTALERLANDPDLRARLGHAARDKAERELSVAQYARHCEAVFEAAVSKTE